MDEYECERRPDVKIYWPYSSTDSVRLVSSAIAVRPKHSGALGGGRHGFGVWDLNDLAEAGCAHLVVSQPSVRIPMAARKEE